MTLKGKALLDLRNGRLRILNGRTRGDRYGKFTRYPLSVRETPSTLDYIIADANMTQNIMSFMVLSNLGLSDHECLSVSIQSKGFYISKNTSVPIIKKKSFELANADEFRLKINSPIGREKLTKFIDNHAQNNKIDGIA